VIGATAVIHATTPRVKRAGQGATDRASPWLKALLARKAKKPAALALANKMARIV
jgi:hypothetical protein